VEAAAAQALPTVISTAAAAAAARGGGAEAALALLAAAAARAYKGLSIHTCMQGKAPSRCAVGAPADSTANKGDDGCEAAETAAAMALAAATVAELIDTFAHNRPGWRPAG
jgi:hypothetical protein